MKSDKRCLVVGGQGFIGCHLLPALLKDRKQVTSLDFGRKRRVSAINGVSYVTGDYSNRALLKELLKASDEVIHLAYASQPNTSFLDPFSDLAQNVPPTLQLFELAAKYGVRVLFVSSGGTVYGEATNIPVLEDHPTNPIAPYGVTKLTLEKYAYLYAVTHQLNIVIARPSNPYGEGQIPFSGQGFVPTAMALAYQGKDVLIYGKEGTIRDYIYIQDVVSGLLTVLNQGIAGEIYNIGSGMGLSNMQMIDCIRPILSEQGKKLRTLHVDERPFDVRVNVLDSGKLNKLGWQASMPLERGLSMTAVWLKQYIKEIL